MAQLRGLEAPHTAILSWGVEELRDTIRSTEENDVIPTGEIQRIQYGICELSDLDEMGTLLAEIFARFDPPPVAMHITPAEFEKFIRCFLPRVETDGLTIVARDAESKQMVGALLTEDAAARLPSGLDLLSGKFDPIFNLLEQLSVDYWGGQEPSPGGPVEIIAPGE